MKGSIQDAFGVQFKDKSGRHVAYSDSKFSESSVKKTAKKDMAALELDIRAFINTQHFSEKGFDSIYEMLNFNPEWWSVGTFNVIVKHKFDVFRLINSGLAVDITKVLHNER